jgi:RNA polymerase sigma factor (sigma-70 family)
MSEDAELLRRYATEQSEAAFAELIRRHVDLVYSAALRLVNGDAHRAEDITQQVFTEFARHARKLVRHPAPIGWLYTTTRWIALRAIRTEQRRALREREAHTMNELLRRPEPETDWHRLGPVLEDAMHELGENDRHAVLLRFFQNKNLKEVGAALGLNENAARMRVDRALDKLRVHLERRGVKSTAATLTVLLVANSVAAAPATFVATLASASLTAVAGAGTGFTMIQLMFMTKLQAAIAGAIAVTVAAVPVVIYKHNQVNTLARDNETMRQELAGLKAQSGSIATAPADAAPADSSGELLRLRGEVTRLRAEAQGFSQNRRAAGTETNSMDGELEALQARVRLLKQKLAESPEEKIPEQELLSANDWLRIAMTADVRNNGGIRYNLNQLRIAAKDQFALLMAAALRNHVDANNGQLPANLAQLKSYLPSTVSDAMLERYDLVHTGSVNELASGTPIVGEKASNNRMMDSVYSIGLDRYQVKIVTQVVDGRGMRVGSPEGEMTKFIPGIQLR